jgi:exonuclease SbcC
MRVKKLKEERETLSENVFKYGVQIGGLKEKISGMQLKNDELTTLRKEHNKKLEELSIFDRLIKMFGKSGIQTLLLEAVISDLEKTSNDILSSISNDQFTISLETQRLGSDGVSLVETLDLNVKKDGSLYNFASLSGGEQFRIALALRIALSDVSTRHGGSSLEFLLLDEINSPLDKNGVETLFVNVIKSLESKYKILVITHDDSLKERFDNILDVSKINGESTVAFSTR